MQVDHKIELWGGIEYTLNRVRDQYHDQLEYTGHYYRKNDIDTIACLGIKTLRYPILWERHQPQKEIDIDWSFSEKNLLRLRDLSIRPIVGLVHHGSGPQYVNFFDGSFEKGLASYAGTVAEKFPWIEYYTPVNEPLTTARFCGLYGHWYPHKQDEHSFYTILLSECKATVKAMQAIRQVNPNAKLVQTEDLGKTYGTTLLNYQAQFDNHRRWLTFDLLCGKVNEQHALWNHLTTIAGISPESLYYFVENTCPPDICGLNYYMTSERYLDEDLEKYPVKYHSGNGRHTFADVERVRVDLDEAYGIKLLLREAYQHLHLPMAITECHLHCTRDEQMRWFNQIWQMVHEIKNEGVDIRAVTAWALFGTYGWDKLMIESGGTYETGAFKVTTGFPKQTLFAKMLQTLSANNTFHHPLLKRKAWWQRKIRLFYGITEAVSIEENDLEKAGRPLLIIGEEGILSNGFHHICYERNIPSVFIKKQDVLSSYSAMNDLLWLHKPWAVISIEGYEDLTDNNVSNTCKISSFLAAACKDRAIKFARFSPELSKEETNTPLYASANEELALNIYDSGNTEEEDATLSTNPNALLIRTGSLFSPWDDTNIVNKTIERLQQNEIVKVSNSNYSSFAYVPDIIHIGLDWLLDDESGVFYMANSYNVSEAYLTTTIAKLLGKNVDLVEVKDLGVAPKKLCIALLPMNKRVKLLYLENALQRYVETALEINQSLEVVPF